MTAVNLITNLTHFCYRSVSNRVVSQVLCHVAIVRGRHAQAAGPPTAPERLSGGGGTGHLPRPAWWAAAQRSAALSTQWTACAAAVPAVDERTAGARSSGRGSQQRRQTAVRPRMKHVRGGSRTRVSQHGTAGAGQTGSGEEQLVLGRSS